MFKIVKRATVVQEMVKAIAKPPENFGRIARAFSIMTPANITAKKINDNLLYKEIDVEGGQDKEMPKPLVLLFSWMAAKQKHLEKFAEYYLNRQCDVLSIRISPGQLLFPERGSQVIAENVVEFVQQDDMKHRQLMVHAFSVGAYLYTEVVQKMQSMAKHEVEILQRIACQVYDSPVDVNNVPEGLSKAVTENPILQFTFRKSIEAYLKMLHNMATRHYNVASKTFFASPVTAPSLFFYSKKDPIGNPATVEEAISSLRDKMGYTVYGKCFEDSLHVSHLYKYPDEYFSTLDSFYNQLDYFKEN